MPSSLQPFACASRETAIGARAPINPTGHVAVVLAGAHHSRCYPVATLLQRDFLARPAAHRITTHHAQHARTDARTDARTHARM
eukprot:5313545-Amphidinium_carterae.1